MIHARECNKTAELEIGNLSCCENESFNHSNKLFIFATQTHAHKRYLMNENVAKIR
jgi:hypothetical protein